ncbi:type II toxin-antitoxin system VapC family toxin [Arthrobacter castelli]|uniref:type II toxin-antitoxin system VapC family toxin n=1 Tax=Arthrobacter castelli TaxID=271431 RepID=UPI001FE03150|nr:type II toxin-antitoxin system VapC family toxin [Arthrobacter castelli]
MDTSAALKLAIQESQSDALARYLTDLQHNGDTLAASMLLYTELHCAAKRRPTPPPAKTINSILSAMSLDDVERSDLTYAAAMAGKLRSADAIHLACALRLNANLLVAYDIELLTAAEDAGLNVHSPA